MTDEQAEILALRERYMVDDDLEPPDMEPIPAQRIEGFIMRLLANAAAAGPMAHATVRRLMEKTHSDMEKEMLECPE